MIGRETVTLYTPGDVGSEYSSLTILSVSGYPKSYRVSYTTCTISIRKTEKARVSPMILRTVEKSLCLLNLSLII